MDTRDTPTTEQETPRYEQPDLRNYGTLVDLTAAAGNVTHLDIPHGTPNTAYPS